MQVRLKWDLSVAWPMKRMNFILSVRIMIFYRGGHNVLPFLHCCCSHLISPSKSVSVKRELTFLEACKWVEQEGAPHQGHWLIQSLAHQWQLQERTSPSVEKDPGRMWFGTCKSFGWQMSLPLAWLVSKKRMGLRCSGDSLYTTLLLCLFVNKYYHLLIIKCS